VAEAQEAVSRDVDLPPGWTVEWGGQFKNLQAALEAARIRLRPVLMTAMVAAAIAFLAIMPLVSWGKLRAAREIGSAALRAEAKETLACSYLSLTLLFGLVANAAAGWWWADPIAALLMVPWLLKEGLEGWRGDDD
jgi:divalent metal cation (Fe/Co/Zn/Cd) transporter